LVFLNLFPENQKQPMNFANNQQMRMAYEFVENTSRNVFLTGRAGTGKTTFLRFIKTHSYKRSVVVAPTGVAAINAGGVTIHSFFQLPFGPILPDDVAFSDFAREKNYLKVSREKINIIKSLDLLIVDEVSMVRADLLDGMDMVLRRYRNSSAPFGGVQLLLIGDLQQLPPVVKDEERDLLSKYYTTFFFFGSRALRQTPYISIELKQVYRQSDQEFINLLNKVRDNSLDQGVLERLNRQHRHDVNYMQQDGYITLTTHNNQARDINERRLNEISSTPRIYTAKLDGDFPEISFPTEQKLVLKKGAQVMFVKNDPSQAKQFFNGKIGKITDFGDDTIIVTCEGNEEIEVNPLTWENTRYSLDQETKEIKENIIGSFTQYPLKLAWAITIHKSQGLTFDKAIIDARSAFTHGQVYVALSRCRSLDGLVLSTLLTPHSIKNDYSIKDFTQNIELNTPDDYALNQAKVEFQHELLEDLFNFSPIHYRFMQLIKTTKEHVNALDQHAVESINTCHGYLRRELMEVASRFIPEVKKYLEENPDAEKNSILQVRIAKASSYFEPRLSDEILKPLAAIDFDADNKQIRKALTDLQNRLITEIKIKHSCLKLCKEGFKTASYLETRAKAAIETEPSEVIRKHKSEALPVHVEHPLLLQQLRTWRDNVAEKTGKPIFMILPKKSMTEICQFLPVTKKALQTIHGFGKAKVDMYAEDIISLVLDYCTNHDIQPAYEIELPEKPAPVKKEKPEKGSTFIKSLELYKGGMTIEEVAKERNMAVSTIQGHLARFVLTGEIPVEKMVHRNKIDAVTSYLNGNSAPPVMSEIKNAMGEEYTWADIRFILAHLEHQKSRNLS
jgi:hypothetical protein